MVCLTSPPLIHLRGETIVGPSSISGLPYFRNVNEIWKSSIKSIWGNPPTKNLITTYAVFINDLNKSIGSSGGGKDDLAQAGIDFKDNLSQLEEKISHIISEKFQNKGK